MTQQPFVFFFLFIHKKRYPRDVVVNVLDYNIVVSEFELKSRFYVHFQAYTFGNPISRGCRIHWLHLCRGVIPPTNECPGYNTKQPDSEAPVMLELWEMQSTFSLPLLPDPLWLGMVIPERVLSKGQIELFNHLTVCK